MPNHLASAKSSRRSAHLNQQSQQTERDTAVKTATRQKHTPLNQSISLNKPIYDEDGERTLLDVVATQKTSDPQELVINQEVSEDIKERIQENLSDLESQVLRAYLEGKSYRRCPAI